MVEINNQRKAFLDMLAWSEGTDNGRQKTRNHGYDVIVGGELFTDYSDHPRKLVTLNSKPWIRRWRYQLLSRWWDAHRKQLGLKDSLRKSGRCGIAADWLAWRFTYDWSWWYPSGNRPLQQYLGFTAGRWLWSVRAGADSLIAKFRSGWNLPERLMYEQSHRDYPASASFPYHRLPVKAAVNHYRDNAITYKAQRQKCQRTEAGERGNYWHADASAWCCCARCKIHEGVRLMLKLKMMLCVMMLPLVVVGCISVPSVSAWLTMPSGVDNAASPWLQTPLNGIISPSERGWSLCKNNWKEPRSILMSSADRVAHIDGQLMQLLWAIHTRFQRSINA